MTDEELSIALDLESVLAATHDAVVERSVILTDDDFEEYDMGTKHGHLIDMLVHVWENYWDEIPVVEPNAGQYVSEMRSLPGVKVTVDVVTRTPGDPEYVEKWLDYHDIVVDDIVFLETDAYKHEQTEYDVYIDDAPRVIDTVPLLYLYDQRWNREVTPSLPGVEEYVYYDLTLGDPTVVSSVEDDRNTAVRVDSLDQVVDDFRERRMADTVVVHD